MHRSILMAIAAVGVVSLVSCFDSPQPVGTSANIAKLITPEMLTQSLSDSPALAERGADYGVWRVPFVTNRDTDTSQDGGLGFGKTFGAMQTGICHVRVPNHRERGACEVAPPGSSSDDPQWTGHLLRQTTELTGPSEFYEQVNTLVKRSVGKDVLVFTHGYRVKFDQPPEHRQWLTKRARRGKSYWVCNGETPVLARGRDTKGDGTTTATRR